MTYHLASLRLRSVGERSARFTDLTLDLTAPVEDADEPSDSVVWLRNGGGKSSLLSLFFALVLPHANDFMGRSVKRSLTDYVDSGDTSHTVAVWHSVEERTLLGEPARVLVTGAIYEWHDLRRPADPDQDRDRLGVSWYAFYAVPGVIDATTLPLEDAAGQPLQRSAVVTALRELARENAGAMDLSLPKNQREWSDELQNRGIDPELYRRQKEMNHVEGGVEDLFRFASPREFIDFLLDLTVSPEQTVTIATRLASVADLLATKPAKMHERDFCRQAAVGLRRVSTAVLSRAGSREKAQSAAVAAGELAGRFTASIDQAQTALRLIQAQCETAQELHEQASRDQLDATDLAHLYRLHEAELHHQSAMAAEQKASHQAVDAARLAAAWRLTPTLAEHAELSAQLEHVREQARAERLDTKPHRQAVDRQSALLLARLERLSAQVSEAAQEADEAASRHRSDASEHDLAAVTAQGHRTDAIERAAGCRTRLEGLSDSVRAAAATGLLPSAESDPAREYDLAEQRLTNLRTTLRDTRERRSARRGQRTDLSQRQSHLLEEHGRQDGERTKLVSTRDGFAGQATALETEPRIRDLTEATEDAPVELWAEAESLLRHLHQEISSTDAALIRLEATRLDERRILDGQGRTGVLPTSMDATRVITALKEHEIEAESGWQHLINLCPPGRLAATLTDQHLAQLGCGVVVPTERASTATSVLAALGATTTALVGLYTAAAASELLALRRADPEDSAPTPAWTGLHAGLLDSSVAESEVTAIRVRHDRIDTDQGALAQRRDADRALIDRLQSLLSACPAGHLDALASRIHQLDDALDQLADSAQTMAANLITLEEAETQDSETETDLSSQIEDLSRISVRLQALAEEAAQSPQWQEHLRTAERDQKQAEQTVLHHQEQGRQDTLAASEYTSAARQNHEIAAQHRAEATALIFLEEQPPVPTDDPAVPLDTLRRQLDDARRTLQTQVSTSVLAERERSLQEQLGRVGRVLSGSASELRETAAQLLARPEGQIAQTRATAVQHAEEVRREADAAFGCAQGDTRTALTELDALRRRPLPRRELPITAEDSQQAETLAVEQDEVARAAAGSVQDALSRLKDLERQDTEAKHRVSVLAALLEGLPEPTVPSAGPESVFEGDEDQARRRKREATEALMQGQDAIHHSETALTNALADVRARAGTYSSVRTPARDRILNDPDETLFDTADPLVTNLELRADMIDAELKGIAKDQEIITASLAHLVSDTLGTLRKAERYSRLPESLGPWAGKKMLRIGFDEPAGVRELHAYIDRVIERRVAEGVKPQGMPLLKDAVHEAVGPRGFTVRVLKPTQDVTAISEDITRLGKWSGGEKLTVCVALYCTLAALRARNTGRGNASGGLLVLDNPIGRASHGSLVQLQRDVAAAHGVQLVYTTGVKDPEAVTLFPNVIRLDNRPGRTRNRRYIVQSESSADPAPTPDGEVTGVRVAHEEHRVHHGPPDRDEFHHVAAQ